MKLRNKKTGEIKNLILVTVRGYAGDDTLAELNEEWEDYEEPRDFWYIDSEGNVESCIRNDDLDKPAKEIGNYFETKEEAEKAVEKLKAWKRLKGKGFMFKDFCRLNDCATMIRATSDGSWSEIYDDLNICFGGEE